jgi:hypothetical protein
LIGSDVLGVAEVVLVDDEIPAVEAVAAAVRHDLADVVALVGWVRQPEAVAAAIDADDLIRHGHGYDGTAAARHH